MDCSDRFREMMKEPCLDCGLPPSECICPRNRHLRFLFWYRERDAKQLIRSVKYCADSAQLRALGELLATVCTQRYDAVTYVPRNPLLIRRYGYDQSLLLAEAVADRLELPFVTSLVSRSVVEQKLLSASQREKSMRGRFTAIPAAISMYPRLLLIDDVSTTGATLHVCSALLRQAGARSVSRVVLAKTPLLYIR